MKLNAMICLVLISSARASEYTVTDLGPLGGAPLDAAPGSSALGIDHGIVVGSAVYGPDAAAVLPSMWLGGGQALSIAAGDSHGMATAINASGTIVGLSFAVGELQPTALKWHDGVVSELGQFEPWDINASGVIVGGQRVLVPHAVHRAFRIQNGSFTVLPDLGGGYAVARAVSDEGDVVGWSRASAGPSVRALLWRGGSVIDLGTLGGASAEAMALDGIGHVVGTAQRGDGAWRAVRYSVSSSGVVTERMDLGDLGLGRAAARGIAPDGTIVGTSAMRAFRWRAGVLDDLNDLIDGGGGWRLDNANAIDHAGRIVGCGRRDGLLRAFLLTPILPADVNGDGVESFLDLVAVLNDWGPCGAPCPADLDGDGAVGMGDLLTVLAALSD